MTKFTDEQIINIFKHCDKSDCIDDCRNCAAHQDGECAIPDLGAQVVQVINRKKAENERLLQKLQQAKSEAIKEFAEKLKEKVKMYNSEGVEEGDLIDDLLTVGETVEIIDNLVKEMMEKE